MRKLSNGVKQHIQFWQGLYFYSSVYKNSSHIC
uniref:Uncharacterized protein n=1 Tax=Rhizophora mucronata TaxID=61149 RepID=A0A2P2NE96_RHIMU